MVRGRAFGRSAVGVAVVATVAALAVGTVLITRAEPDAPTRASSPDRLDRAPTRSMVEAARRAERTRQPVLQATTAVVVGAFPPMRAGEGERPADPGKRMGPCIEASIQPLPPPCGGISITNWVWPKRADIEEDQGVRSPDFATLAITEHPGPDVWTVGFTGDLERHRRELRMVWGGGLCLIERPVSAKTLDEWKERLSPKVLGGEFADLHWLMFGANPETGTLHFTVAWAPPGTAERLSAEYGVPISVENWFQPAE